MYLFASVLVSFLARRDKSVYLFLGMAAIVLNSCKIYFLWKCCKPTKDFLYLGYTKKESLKYREQETNTSGYIIFFLFVYVFGRINKCQLLRDIFAIVWREEHSKLILCFWSLLWTLTTLKYAAISFRICLSRSWLLSIGEDASYAHV